METGRQSLTRLMLNGRNRVISKKKSWPLWPMCWLIHEVKNESQGINFFYSLGKSMSGKGISRAKVLRQKGLGLLQCISQFMLYNKLSQNWNLSNNEELWSLVWLTELRGKEHIQNIKFRCPLLPTWLALSSWTLVRYAHRLKAFLCSRVTTDALREPATTVRIRNPLED